MTAEKKLTRAERKKINQEKCAEKTRLAAAARPVSLTRLEKRALRAREEVEEKVARSEAFQKHRAGTLPAAVPAPGRSVKFDFDLFDLICDGVAAGKTLRQVCIEMGICEKTIRLWILDDRGCDDSQSPPVPGCATLFDRARLLQAEAWADGLIDIAEACTADTAVADKVKIEVHKFLMARNSPQRFGDSSTVVHAGDEKRPLSVGVMSDTLALFVSALEEASRAKSRGPGGSGVLDLEVASSTVHS